MFVILELPPYHACSVRWSMPSDALDLSAYHAVADPYIAAHPGFVTIPTQEGDMGSIHVHATGNGLMRSDGVAETLLVIDQHPAGSPAAANGNVDVRFVHQLRSVR